MLLVVVHAPLPQPLLVVRRPCLPPTSGPGHPSLLLWRQQQQLTQGLKQQQTPPPQQQLRLPHPQLLRQLQQTRLHQLLRARACPLR